MERSPRTAVQVRGKVVGRGMRFAVRSLHPSVPSTYVCVFTDRDGADDA